MKKMSIIILTMLSTTSFSMDANQLKEAALKACDTQLENIPENLREKTKKSCLCTVNKTDYAEVLAAQQSGDNEKIQQDALKVAEACAKEAL